MVHDQYIARNAVKDPILTSGSLVDGAGVNSLGDSNRHKAGNDEGNKGG